MNLVATGRRAGWGLADQSLSSLTNFAFGMVAARELGLAQFGAFGVAFTTYLIVMGICRALTSEALVVRFSATPSWQWRQGTESAAGATVTIASVMALPIVGLGLVLDEPVGDALLGLGMVLPGVLLQDAWRFGFFASGRGSAAFLNDLIRTLLLLVSLVLLAVVGAVSALSLFLAWGGSAAVAAILGACQARLIPRPGRTPAWLQQHRDLVPRYVAEFIATNGVMQLVVYAVGALAGLLVLGNLRAGLLLLGPLNVFCQGIGLALLPRQVTRARQGAAGLLRSALMTSVLIVGVTLSWGLAVSLAPNPIGSALLRSVWDGARSIVLPLSVALAGEFAMFGPRVALRAMADAHRSLNAGLATSALVLACGAGSARYGSANAVVVGLGVANWAGAAIWWCIFVRALRASPEQEPPRLASPNHHLPARVER